MLIITSDDQDLYEKIMFALHDIADCGINKEGAINFLPNDKKTIELLEYTSIVESIGKDISDNSFISMKFDPDYDSI